MSGESSGSTFGTSLRLAGAMLARVTSTVDVNFETRCYARRE
jgi:hypothetical protein